MRGPPSPWNPVKPALARAEKVETRNAPTRQSHASHHSDAARRTPFALRLFRFVFSFSLSTAAVLLAPLSSPRYSSLEFCSPLHVAIFFIEVLFNFFFSPFAAYLQVNYSIRSPINRSGAGTGRDWRSVRSVRSVRSGPDWSILDGWKLEFGSFHMPGA